MKIPRKRNIEKLSGLEVIVCFIKEKLKLTKYEKTSKDLTSLISTQTQSLAQTEKLMIKISSQISHRK